MTFYANRITGKIRSIYVRRLLLPILYLIALSLFWDIFALQNTFFPKKISGPALAAAAFEKKQPYITLDISDLYFSGYANSRVNNNIGGYYYTIQDNTCYFFLLSPITTKKNDPHKEDVSSHLKNITITGRVLEQPEIYTQLFARLTADLDWTEKETPEIGASYIISEPDYRKENITLLAAALIISGIFAIGNLVLFLLYILFPLSSPPGRHLGKYGDKSKLLKQAQEELHHLPASATGNLYLTKHFLIKLDRREIVIIPIDAIHWIYQSSTLYHFLGYHFNLTYTLYIVAKKRIKIHFTRNKKIALDKITTFLLKENPAILLGFDKEYRSKVFALRHHLIAKIVRIFAIMNKVIQIRKMRRHEHKATNRPNQKG